MSTTTPNSRVFEYLLHDLEAKPNLGYVVHVEPTKQLHAILT